MKPATPILILGLAMVFSGPAPAQTTSFPLLSSTAAIQATTLRRSSPLPDQKPPPSSRTNHFFPVPRLKGETTRPLSPSASLPKPGIYQSEPYTCIVIVPGPHPDERPPMMQAPGHNSGDPQMPIYRPELRLIPRGTK